MRLLTQWQYHQLLTSTAIEVEPELTVVEQILSYAASVMPFVHLQHPRLTLSDLTAVYRHGEHDLYHIRAHATKQPDTFLIVAADTGTHQPQGVILIDLQAEFATARLNLPQFGFDWEASESDIRELVPAIDPSEVNPFVVLSLSDGTFMQAYRNDAEFVLEYQLVNQSSHYSAPFSVSAEAVVDALVSYGFGKYEWLSMFE